MDPSNLLEQIIDFLPDATFVIDREGRVIAWNKAMERMTGVKASQMLGKGNYEYSLAFYKERRPVLIDLVNNPVEDLLAKYEYVRREGPALVSETAPDKLILGGLHLLNLACPLFDKDGQVIGAIECIRDITAQKKAEEALRESELKYRKLFETAGEAILLMDGDVFIDCNQKAAEIFAAAKEDIVGNHPYIVSPEFQPDGSRSKEKAIEKIEAALKGRPQYFEWRHRRLKGGLFDAEVSLNAFDMQGRRLLQAIVRDVTDRKALEEERQRALLMTERGAEAVSLIASSPHVSNGNVEELCAELTEIAVHALDVERAVVWLLDDTGVKLINIDSYSASTRSHTSGDVLLEHQYSNEFEALRTSRFIDAHDALTDPRTAGIVEAYFKPNRITSVLDASIRVEGRNLGVICCYHVARPRKWSDREISLVCQLADQVALAILHRERNRAQEALALSERKLRSILQAAPVGITVMKDRRYQSANRYWCEAFGYPEEEILGKTTRMLYESDEDYERVGSALYQEVNRSGIASLETKLKRRDGSMRDCMITVAAVSPEDPSQGTVAVVQDITERKEAETALARSQERYMTLVEESFDGIFIQKGSKIVFTNRRLQEMLGYPADELLGREHWLIYHKDYQDMTRERAQARMRGQSPPSQYEVKLERKDGSWFYGEISAKPISVEGEPGIQVWVKDITEKKRSEEALKESEMRFRELFDSVRDLIFTQDMQGRFLEVNRAMTELFGYPYHDLIGKRPADFMKAELRALFESEYLAGLKNKGYFQGISAYYNKEGRKIYIEYRSNLVQPKDAPPYISGIGRDVTDRIAAEKALKEQEEKIRAILEAAPNPIALFDTDGAALYLNPAFSEVFGFSLEEMKLRSIPFVPAEEREKTAASIRALYRGENPGPLETKRFTKDGRLLDVLIHGSLIKEEGKPPKGMVLGFTDLTAFKRLEAQLLQSQKMESIGRLAGGVAHDFNNMLGVILGRAELALMKLAPGDPVSNDLHDIQKAAERSADLTRQLLGFARRQTVAPKVLDLNDTIAGMLKMLRRLIGEDIDLSWIPGSQIWPVRMDPTQINQVLANLVVNARDAIEGYGRITIRTENTHLGEDYCRDRPFLLPGRYVCLTVSDTGCGIDEKIINQIFDPFFTTKEVGKGTGLGLANVYGIVKQNQGDISVHSEIGKGSSFMIYLPAFSEAPAEDLSGTDTGDVKGGSETVLLVEDEPLVLEMGKTMLERLGYKVLAAQSPQEAIEIARSHEGDIELLITDVIMPEMNGMALSERIAGMRPRIKTLFTSGYTADVIARHGILREGVNFVQKPLKLKELADKIRASLE